jgi:hypothetical protein
MDPTPTIEAVADPAPTTVPETVEEPLILTVGLPELESVAETDPDPDRSAATFPFPVRFAKAVPIPSIAEAAIALLPVAATATDPAP